jgi:mannose-6-phosphate isomerase-like protein (cupin superfamily)
VNVRRVVTGKTSDGKSVFVSDEVIEPIRLPLMPGLEFRRVWGGDEPTALPTDGAQPEARTFFPPVGGYRFAFVTIPPEGSGALPEDLDVQQAVAEVNEKLPGMMEHMEPDNPGMHTTATVDLDLVLTGEMDLELDDGVEVHLRPGDCVVQNGTRHAWHNRTSEPCTMLSILVGAERR